MFLPLSLNICSLILGTQLLLSITVFLLTNKLDHLSSVVPTSHDNIYFFFFFAEGIYVMFS